MLRSHHCGELNINNDSQKVTLCGWVNNRRDHGGVIFIDLRDRYGITQIVFDPKTNSDSHVIAENLRSEYVIKASGLVRKRIEGMENKNLKTGEIEVVISEIEIYSKSEVPPFEINQDKDVREDLRLEYRYLDLRRKKMLNNMILRSNLAQSIREFFIKENFLEVETPIMIKGTPEGSREYLVPSRLHHGNFYVLPQSPQQLKQLLMVSGFDKYFQLPRCFRDEDLRGDRQPEFTQAEIEMSFVEQEDILEVVEKCLIEITKKHAPSKIFEKKFPRMTWQEAMEKYGSDKPDIRFDMKFVNLSEYANKSGFGIFEKSKFLFALPVKKSDGELTRKDIDELTKLAQNHGAGGLAWLKIGENSGPVSKNSKDSFLNIVKEKTELQDGDMVFFGAGEFQKAVEPLGQVRLKIAKNFKMIDKNKFAYLWVVDFPMFAKNEEGEITAEHHPFTMPFPEDLKKIDNDPLSVRAFAYDVILNGNELGGGSIRIHDNELQKKIFTALNISDEDAEKRFGHILKAFKYGVPPHGGLALGFDRLVMIFAEEETIREVIPFPKNQSAQDLMLGAPSKMPEEQIEEMGISINEIE